MRARLAMKLNLPQASSDQIARTHLLSLLNSGLDAPFALIVGPTGAGKSTLAAAWLRTLGGRVSMIVGRPGKTRPSVRTAWLALDDGDNNPDRFFPYLLAAIRSAAPGFGQTIFDAFARNEALPPERIVDAITTEAAGLRGSIVVALDDFHTLTDPTLQTALKQLIRRAPPQLHFLLVSREEPPFAADLLRDGYHPVILRAADLFFTEEETIRFFHQAMGSTIPGDLTREIYTRTEGWPAGLRLAALSLRHVDDPVGLTEQALQLPTDWVADYLAEALFAGQPASMQQFLLYTALPEQFSLGLATTLLDAIDPLRIMETLHDAERRNLLLIRLDPRGEWYRYHTLTREYLLRRLALTATPAQIAALHGRAAAWLARAGHTLAALGHFLAAGDHEGAARLIETNLPEYLAATAWPDLAAYMRRLPEDLIQARPGLLVARAYLLRWQYQPAAMQAAIDRAEGLLSAHPETAGLLSLSYLRGQIALLRGTDNHNGLSEEARLHQIETALTWLSPQSASWEAAQQIKARLLLRLGRIVEADQLLENSAAAPTATPEPFSDTPDSIQAPMIHAATPIEARAQQLRTWLGAAQAAGKLGDALWMRVHLGSYYYQMNLLQETLEQWEAALAQGELLDQDRLALIARAMMEIWAELGRLDQAEQVLSRVRQIIAVAGFSWPNEIDAELAAYLALLHGEREPAEQWLAAQSAAPDATPFNFRTTQRLHILLALATPQNLARATMDARVLLAAPSPDQLYTRNQMRVLLAAALWQRHRQDEALNYYRDAICEGYGWGHRRIYLIPGQPARDMLAALSAEPKTAGAARDLLAQIPPRPIIPILTPTHPLLNSLTDRELIVLDLVADKLTNSAIANHLGVSPNTVRNQIASIFRKFNVSRRQEAVAIAREIGLIN